MSAIPADLLRHPPPAQARGHRQHGLHLQTLGLQVSLVKILFAAGVSACIHLHLQFAFIITIPL